MVNIGLIRKMHGSPKQIDWAIQIISEANEFLLGRIQHYIERTSLSETDAVIWGVHLAAYKKVYADLESMILKLDDVSKIIKYRSSFKPQMLDETALSLARNIKFCENVKEATAK